MNGIIIVDKPKNYTSHDIVNKLRKILNIKKIGHTGTLDPNATGVLPLLIGEATKLSKYLINHDKTYEVTLKLGEKTNTADSEGNIIQKKCVEWENITDSKLKEFIGKHEQIPPIYSAIKVNGRKLYEYARKGIEVEIKPREIEIYDMQLKNINKNNNTVEFKVECSKGTYIRSICEDIAEKTGNIAYMLELRRTKVGSFSIEDAKTIDELESNKNINYITIEHFFKNNDSLVLGDKEIYKLLNGVKLKENLKDGIYKIYNKNNVFIGIASVKNNFLKRDIILNQ